MVYKHSLEFFLLFHSPFCSLSFFPSFQITMDHNNHVNTVQNQPKNINKKRERNRIKKKKYKLKIKHKKANTTPKYTKPSLTVKTNHGWRWFTLKSKQLSLRQKKLLFQAHNLYKIKERNSALIFQLQCQLNTIFFKDKNSTIYQVYHFILKPDTSQPARRHRHFTLS